MFRGSFNFSLQQFQCQSPPHTHSNNSNVSPPPTPQSSPVQCKPPHLKVAAASLLSAPATSAAPKASKPQKQPKAKSMPAMEQLLKDRASFVWAWVLFPVSSKSRFNPNQSPWHPNIPTFTIQDSRPHIATFTVQHSNTQSNILTRFLLC